MSLLRYGIHGASPCTPVVPGGLACLANARMRRTIAFMLLTCVAVRIAAGADKEMGWPDPLPAPMTPEAARTARAGLAYLVRMQRPDGRWAREVGIGYSVSMTSFAGLALLASGSTPEEGPYAESLRRAIEYLVGAAERKGSGYINDNDGGKYPHEVGSWAHGYALLFLSQCLGMELMPEMEEKVRAVLQRGTAFAMQDQNALGGWYYSPVLRFGDYDGPTIAVLHGLQACRNVGVHVPPKKIGRAVRFVLGAQVEDGGIAVVYPDYRNFRSEGRRQLSVATLACFYTMGICGSAMGGSGSYVKEVDRLTLFVDRVIDEGIGQRGHVHYTQLYAALVRYQQGGEAWPRYYEQQARTIVGLQSGDGELCLFETPISEVGSLFRTSICCIILQLPLGYLPMAQSWPMEYK